MSMNIRIFIFLLLLVGCQSERAATTASVDVVENGCDEILPRPENASLRLSDASDEWFQVYEVADGVFSIVEPYQWQETVSHLIVGQERAVLFDTGIGLLPIKPVVERITKLPVSVLNSHTHYDHVGGNHEFSTVLAIDTEYTKANMAGFGHERIAEDFTPDSFCKGPPRGVDVSSFYTRSWTASGYVVDGEHLDLGGRTLEVLHIPGHTPDATALLDRQNRLLFTGDTYYADRLWLFVPETNLDDYQRAIVRLAAIESDVDYLLGAHTAARVDANRLAQVEAAFGKLRAGEFESTTDSSNRLDVQVGDVRFLTSQQALDGNQGDTSKGGSGLDTWP